MDIVLHNVEQSQLTLIRELAKALGLHFEERAAKADENTLQIKAAIDRVEAGAAELHTLDWEDFRKMAFPKTGQQINQTHPFQTGCDCTTIMKQTKA